MKKKTLVLGAMLVALLATVSVHAEEITPAPTGKFGEAVRELRQQNQEERKGLMEKNQEMRKNAIEEGKKARKALGEENKGEREQLRDSTKKLLEGKTPEERLTLMPTIKAGRQALTEQNRTQIQTLKKAQWDSKKSVTENIRTNLDTFIATVRSRRESLWASFGKK